MQRVKALTLEPVAAPAPPPLLTSVLENAADPGLNQSPPAFACPGLSLAPPADRVTFGMKVAIAQGCCVDKLKQGLRGGCCDHIPLPKFLENYRKVVEACGERVTDPHLRLILAGKLQPGDPFDEKLAAQLPPLSVKPSLKTEKQAAEKCKRAAETFWQRALLTPYRFVKWLLIGFWLDVQHLWRGKPAQAEKISTACPAAARETA